MCCTGENTSGNNNTVRVEFKKCTCPEAASDGLMGRCFITGDQCPHKKRIIANRIKRHAQGKIRAFVVMPFSPMTDALYRWVLQDLIKSSLNTKSYYPDGSNIDEFVLKDEQSGTVEVIEAGDIEITRCDDFIHNSHVICESICSIIQESDLVVVDLSYRNPNVFYEFGLAVALGKKILPICYRESYYEQIPDSDMARLSSFDWKRTLFEFFSLNSREPDGPKSYGGDERFAQFPFTGENHIIGRSLLAAFEHSLAHMDNLLIYDPCQPPRRQRVSIAEKINSFSRVVGKVTRGLPKELAEQLSGSPAFCNPHDPTAGPGAPLPLTGMDLRGDRILLLHSEAPIPNPDKDRENMSIPYNFGEVCRLAINQANYAIESGDSSANSTGLERKMWDHVYNCTEVQNMEHPLFADTVHERKFDELDFLLNSPPGGGFPKDWSFTYLDVMLARAQHCHMAFIDMRGNLIQALFWMGLFHGRGRFVVPIHYDGTLEHAKPEKNGRIISDISGLWNAYFQCDAPEKFTKVAENVLRGIHRSSEHLCAWEKARFLQDNGLWSAFSYEKDTQPENPPSGDAQPEKSSVPPVSPQELDEHYRQTFWDVMLAHGDVLLYPTFYIEDIKATISHWDYSAMAYIEACSGRRNRAFHTILKTTHSGKTPEACSNQRGQQRSSNLIAFGNQTDNRCTKDALEQIPGQFFKRKVEPKPLPSPNVKSKLLPNPDELRGFLPGDWGDSNSGWMADFISEETIKKIREPGVKLEHPPKELYGQLVFLRCSGDDSTAYPAQFKVLLEGASGPATLAMADILGPNEFLARERSRGPEGQSASRRDAVPENSLLFYWLQKSMLRCCDDALAELVRERLGNEDHQKCRTILAPAANYLMMCLCDRFLPVASERFMLDLRARMRLLLKRLKRDFCALGGGPGIESSCFNTVNTIFEDWFTWFEAVRGAAVITKTHITSTGSEYDTRWPESIEIAVEDGKNPFHLIRKEP